jgi:hypothetical protein
MMAPLIVLPMEVLALAGERRDLFAAIDTDHHKAGP